MFKDLQKLLVKEMGLLPFSCTGITYESLHRTWYRRCSQGTKRLVIEENNIINSIFNKE